MRTNRWFTKSLHNTERNFYFSVRVGRKKQSDRERKLQSGEDPFDGRPGWAFEGGSLAPLDRETGRERSWERSERETTEGKEEPEWRKFSFYSRSVKAGPPRRNARLMSSRRRVAQFRLTFYPSSY